MTVRVLRLLVAAPAAELLAVAAMLVPGMVLFFTLDATTTARMIEMQRLALWTAPATGFALCLIGGWWVARRAGSGHGRNGAALGGAVAIIDLALLIASGAPFGVLMVSSFAARIAGGYCGGLIAKQRESRAAMAR